MMNGENKLYPLSQSELGIYLESQNPNNAYNLPFYMALPEETDTGKLTEAIRAFFRAHPYVFTQFTTDEEGNVRKHIVPGEIEIPEISVGSLEELPIVPFEINDKPLYRLAYYLVGEQRYLFFDFHHSIMDGASIKLWADELWRLYDGEEPVAEQMDANAYAVWEEEFRGSDAYQEARQYYTDRFGGIEESSAPLPDQREGEPRAAMIKRTLKLSNSELRPVVKARGIKTSAYFLGVYTYLLSRLQMEKNALITTVHNGRTEETRHSAGMFVRTLPMYTGYTDEQTVTEYLDAVSCQLTDNVRYDLYSYADIHQDLGLQAEVMFAYQGDYMFMTSHDGQEIRLIHPESTDAKGLMSVEVHRIDDHYEIWYEYRADLYRDYTIKHIIDLYDHLLGEFLSDKTMKEICLTDEAEMRTLDSYNQTDISYLDFEHTVLDYIKENTKRDPDRPMIVFKDKTYTYGQVKTLSDRLAAHLRKLGCGREKVVSVLIPKCEYIVIASLGVLKSGSAYQPLDPSYPQERLQFMMKDAGVKTVILDRALEHLIPDFEGNKVYLDEIGSLPEAPAPRVRIRPEDLFIMLYTSGSTGTPKGVMLEHHNLMAFCQYYIKMVGMNSESRVSSYASYGFDANMLDLYPTMMAGGTIYVIPEEMRLDLTILGQYLNDNGITHAFMTTQVGRQVVEEIDLTTMKHFLVGGEKLVPVNPPTNYILHNIYGPTEGTVFCCGQPVDKLYDVIPIGKSNDTYKFYVLDENGNRLPWGVKGELYISGPQVGRGYLHRDAENKKAFLRNPFDDDPLFKSFYRTGDIVRFLRDGVVDFVGRNDGQVKIRGFRVELSEVERIIRDFPGIKDATVKDFTDPSGIKYIVGYVVSPEKVDIDALKAFIGENKPPYMIPAYIMQIDRIPLNQNQKVNKRALPEPKVEAQSYTKPETPVQQQIFDILAAILGHDSFGVDSDLFEAGLTSVSSIRFTVRLSKAFDRPFKNSDLRDYPTVRKLAELVGSGQEKHEYAMLDHYPLTKTQEGILVECISHPNATLYNIPNLLKLDPSIDPERLAEAIRAALRAHPYAMSRLTMDDQGNVVANRRPEEPEVSVIRTESLDKKSLIRPFPILENPLYRAEIYICPDEQYLFLDFHHIVCDGTSELVMLQDINRAYAGETLEPETFSGYEAALEEREERAGDRYTAAKAYYTELLSSVDTDIRLRKDLKTGAACLQTADYTAQIPYERMLRYANENGLTMNAVFNYVFGLTLAKFVYKDDVLFTTIYNGRSDSRMENMVSMLVKTLPVTVHLSEEAEIAEQIRTIKNQLEKSQQNDLYAFSEMAADFGVQADTMFAYQGDSFRFDMIGGKHAESVLLDSDTPKSAFSLDVFVEDGRFRFRFEYDGSQYNEGTISAFYRTFVTVLEQLGEAKKQADLHFVSVEDRAMYDRFNDTEEPIPEISFNRMLEVQVERVPDRPAVIAQDGQYTYRELNAAANRIAHSLIDRGLTLGAKVVTMMPRVKDAYAVRQGIIKSGAAFVPVDPAYPDDRIAYIIENSGAGALIATGEILQSKQGLLAKLNVPALDVQTLLDNEKSDNPDIDISPESLCYMIYTSGSTGKPKGVMIRHRNLVNYCLDGKNLATYEYRLVGDVTSCSFASLSFDASLQEENVPLSHGYTAVIASEEEIRNPLQMADTILKNGVNLMFLTPSFVANVLDVPRFVEALKQLKVLDMGAEAVSPELVGKLRAHGVNAEIFNGYGPTETTVTCTYHHVTDAYVTIGKPVGNTSLYLLDPHGHLLPICAVGDLTIAGASVGAGYLNLPEKTAEAFIQLDGKPAYRSGDLARYNTEGNMEFFGRMDNQVKLRGLRVELDEIEKVIQSYEGISSVVVVVRNNASEGDFLAAYYTSAVPIDQNDLTAYISTKLTPYMVPKVMMHLDKMPLTANGKVDRKALPEPITDVASREIHAPRTPLEQKLAALFAKALGEKEVGIDEDFFDRGGTSLSVSRVVMLAMAEGLPVAYKDVFDYSTVEQLAAYIQKNEAPAEPVFEEVSEAAAAGEPELEHNRIRFVDEIVEEKPLGTVLLTGATGFLGSHVLRELLRQERHVIALVRGGALDSETRLKALMMYYFDDAFDEEIERLVDIVDGDITTPTLSEIFRGRRIDTMINCAACVKHFAADDIIERINVGGVVNMIELAKEHKARLIQISTLSVAGENIDGKFDETFRLTEAQLSVGQDVSNKYINSKFKAEQAVLKAIGEGLDAKIIRVGNLMGRQSDGEFQINSITNGFIRNLRGYLALGCFPVSDCDTRIDFSPIDEVAKAVLLLAKSNRSFTLFHVANSHEVEMGDVIDCMNRYGFKIKVVSDGEFNSALQKMMASDDGQMMVSSLIAYSSSDKHLHEYILTDNSFSIKALYRMGYKWPITDDHYLMRVIEALDSLDFFSKEDE
ncbi:MAG: amino acid adenylation domain-containing protein [Firmicutes bacterium]|nr:amino acid adenylation domain-containing protein [Bacillota bacterium]